MSRSSRRISRIRQFGISARVAIRRAMRARSSKSASRRISTSRSAVTERSKLFTRLSGRLITSARRLSKARRARCLGRSASSGSASPSGWLSLMESNVRTGPRSEQTCVNRAFRIRLNRAGPAAASIRLRTPGEALPGRLARDAELLADLGPADAALAQDLDVERLRGRYVLVDWLDLPDRI